MAYRSGSIIILIIFDRSALLGKTSSSNPLFLIKKLEKADFSAKNWHSAKSFGGKICHWPIDQVQSLYL